MFEIFADTTYLISDSLIIELSIKNFVDTLINDLSTTQDTLFVKNLTQSDNTFDLNGILTLLATIAACLSTYYSFQAIKLSQNDRIDRNISRINESNHKYYEIIVVQPSLQIFNGYLKDSKEIFDSTILKESTNQEIIKIILDEWSERHADFMLQISTRLRNWVKTEIRINEIDDFLLKLEEDISQTLTVKSDELEFHDQRRYFLQQINSQWSQIITLIMKSDPLFTDNLDQ